MFGPRQEIHFLPSIDDLVIIESVLHTTYSYMLCMCTFTNNTAAFMMFFSFKLNSLSLSVVLVCIHWFHEDMFFYTCSSTRILLYAKWYFTTAQ